MCTRTGVTSSCAWSRRTGTVYTLLSRSCSSADNVDQTFTVNLSSETRNGTWALSVQDAADEDTGFIDSWTLTL